MKTGPRPLPPNYYAYSDFPDFVGITRKRPNLSRKPGETDTAYRDRLREAIGGQDVDARLAASEVEGKCLDLFGGQVEHAIFIGWRGIAGRATPYHEKDCGCVSVWTQKVRDAESTLKYRQDEAAKAAAALAAAETALREVKLAAAGAIVHASMAGESPEVQAQREQVFKRILGE